MRLLTLLAVPALALGLVACDQPASVTSPAPAVAAPPPNPVTRPVAELRGTPAAGLDTAMRERGYTQLRQRGNTTLWMNTDRTSCVRTVTSQNRVQSTTLLRPAQCRR